MLKSFRYGALVPALAIILLMAVATVLPGCATLSNPQNQLAEQITVQYATGKFIEVKQTVGERALRAIQVRAVATQIKAVAASDSATVAALQALATAKIATANLQPSDKLLADALVIAITNELTARVNTGVLTPENRVVVTQMLDWVMAACDAYTVPVA